jgi:hypothetical protein
VRKADNLPATCESGLSRKCGNLDVSQPYGPPRPVRGTALHFVHNILIANSAVGKPHRTPGIEGNPSYQVFKLQHADDYCQHHYDSSMYVY